VAEKRLLWAGYGHYMELNLSVFLKTGRFKWFNLSLLKSDGFTGVFLWISRENLGRGITLAMGGKN
jgi:hypothetical protein